VDLLVCVVVCCSGLQWIAVCDDHGGGISAWVSSCVLQRVAVNCNALQCLMAMEAVTLRGSVCACCSVLQRVVYCIKLHDTATH